MISLERTNSKSEAFISLVRELDAELAIRDGEDNAFYSQYNKIDAIRYAVVASKDGNPLGCGAIKEFSPGIMEIKRMFVSQESRSMGIASLILKELEKWAAELGYSRCILETGKRQPEAISLYLKNNYKITSNYGQYAGVENSVCFEKFIE